MKGIQCFSLVSQGLPGHGGFHIEGAFRLQFTTHGVGEAPPILQGVTEGLRTEVDPGEIPPGQHMKPGSPFLLEVEEVLVLAVEPAGRGAYPMPDATLVGDQIAVAVLKEPETEVCVFVSILKLFIKGASLNEKISLDQHAGCGDGMPVPDFGFWGLGPAIPGMSHGEISGVKVDASVVDGGLPGVVLNISYAADLMPAGRIHHDVEHGFQPAGLGHDIVVQEKYVFPAGRFGALIVAPGETLVVGIVSDDPGLGQVPQEDGGVQIAPVVNQDKFDL